MFCQRPLAQPRTACVISPLKVLIVVEPGLNGVFRHVEGLCDYLLQQDGVRVGLAYSSRRSSGALVALVERVKAAGCPVVDLGVTNAPRLGDALAFYRLAKLARVFRPDVIHSHSTKAGVLARCLRLCGFRIVQLYTPNAYYGMSPRGNVLDPLYNGIEMFLGRIGATINVSKSERQFGRQRLRIRPANQILIPNAVDCSRFSPPTADQRRAVRESFSIPAAAYVFGTVGRYSIQKDPHTLYTAVIEFLKKHENAWFCHLGAGELYNEVSARLKSEFCSQRIIRIEYADDTSHFYQCLDGFVLASRYEGLALSAIEAMATGLPIALTRCSGNEDLGLTGCNSLSWADIGAPAQLLDAIERIYRLDPSASNHREVAKQSFGVDAVYGQICTTYHACRENFATSW